MAVAASPFAATAWSFLTLLEVEEFEHLSEDAASLSNANRLAIAFHEPKKLEAERQSLLGRMRAVATISVADAKARGLEMVQKILKGRVLEDGNGR